MTQLRCFACGQPWHFVINCPTHNRQLSSASGKRPQVLAEMKNDLIPNNRPTVNLVISGILVTALVDTGATCSLLRRVFNLVVNMTHRSNVLHKTVPLKGLGGVSLQVDGRTQIQVGNVNVPLDVVICRNIPHEMMLGNDSLRVGNGVIDLKAMFCHGIVSSGH